MIRPEDYEEYKEDIEEARNDPLTSMLSDEQIIETAKEARALTNRIFRSKIENPYNTLYCKISPNEVIDPKSLEKTGTVKAKLLIEKDILEETTIIFGLLCLIYTNQGKEKEPFANYCRYKYELLKKATNDTWLNMNEDIIYIVRKMFEECENEIFPDNYDELSKKERKFKYTKFCDIYYVYNNLILRMEEASSQITKQVNREYIRKGTELIKKMDEASEIMKRQDQMEKEKMEEEQKYQEEHDDEEELTPIEYEEPEDLEKLDINTEKENTNTQDSANTNK